MHRCTCTPLLNPPPWPANSIPDYQGCLRLVETGRRGSAREQIQRCGECAPYEQTVREGVAPALPLTGHTFCVPSKRLCSRANDSRSSFMLARSQGLTLVPVSAQLEFTLPLPGQLKLTLSPMPKLTRGCGPKVRKLSSNGSGLLPKVLKLSSEVSECKPLLATFPPPRSAPGTCPPPPPRPPPPTPSSSRRCGSAIRLCAR